MQNSAFSLSRRTSKRKTLQESYRQRQLLVERVRRADERLIAESAANSLLEALDKDDLKKATEVLNKLNAIKKVADSDPGLTGLSEAIKAAADDVNDFMGGGLMSFLKKGLSSITKRLFGGDLDQNPVLKSLTLLNSLESGIKDLNSVIKNNIPSYDDKSEKTILDQVPDEKAKKNLKKAVGKAFQPEGIFSKIKSLFGGGGGGMPYVKNIDMFITGILDIKPQTLAELTSAVSQGPSTEEAAALVRSTAQASSGGGQQAATQSGTIAVSSSDQLAQAYARGLAAQKKQDPAAAADEAKKDPKKFTQSFMADVEKKSGQKPAVVKAVITTLIKKKKLLGDLQVDHRLHLGKTLQESWMDKRKLAELTIGDVLEAKKAFRESKGSMHRWVEILIEGSGAGKWQAKIDKGDFKSIEDLKDAFKNKMGKASGFSRVGSQIQKRLLASLEKKLEGAEKPKGPPPKPGEPKPNLISDDDIKKAASQIQNDKIDLTTLQGKAQAIKFIKSQFGLPDTASAKEFLEKNILPKIEKAGDKEKAGVSPNLKFLDNPKIKSNIDSVKSAEDLIKLLTKIADSLESKAAAMPEPSASQPSAPAAAPAAAESKRFNLPLILEAISKADASKQSAFIKKTIELIKKIVANPKSAEKLLSQLTQSGGLRDKVSELIKTTSTGDGKSPSEAEKDETAGTEESSTGKHAAFIKDIQDEFKGIEPKAVEAVLDAIPEFMKVAA
jgi:hypothetical protein